MEELKVINLRIPQSMYKEAADIAKAKGQTMSALLRLALAEYIERETKAKK